MMNKFVRLCLISGLVLNVAGGTVAEGASIDVPLGHWSYTSVNQLIASGKLKDYERPIPADYTMSRLEMAAIIEKAEENKSALSNQERNLLDKLGSEYYYDVKKIELLHQVDVMDKLNKKENMSAVNEKNVVPPAVKHPTLDDRYSFWAMARIRFEKKFQDTGTTTAFKHINLQIYQKYRINDHWNVELGHEFQRSMDTLNDENPRPNDGDKSMQANIATALNFQGDIKGVNVKIGRWYDYDVFGYALDGAVAGGQVEFGKKLRVTLFNGRCGDWSWMTNTYWRDYTAIKFRYPIDKKTNVFWGAYWIQPLARQYQSTDKKRIFYTYMAGEHRFSKDWSLAMAIGKSNADIDYVALKNYTGCSTTTKDAALFAKLTYKQINLQKPGSYDIWLSYHKEPQITQYGNTDWWESNAVGLRLGFDYVLDKNLFLNAYYTRAHDIDTGKKRDGARVELDTFF